MVAAPVPKQAPAPAEDEETQGTGQNNASVDVVLEAGAGTPLLPPPAERRHLRQMWGTSIEEVADALGVEPEEIEAWEAGRWEPAAADQRAYCRLLHGFQDAMPAEYEPDWAALRPPQRCATDTSTLDTTEASALPAALPQAGSNSELIVESRHGQRHMRLAGDFREGERVELSVVVCTPGGEILGELDGEMDTADLNAVGELLREAASATTSASARKASAAAPSRGARWSEEDKARLVARFRSGAQPEELAEEFGRSLKSIRWKLFQLNLAPFPEDLLPERRTPPLSPPKAYSVEDLRRTHPNSHKRWTAEDDELLARRCAQGASLQELITEFGRNEGAICSRLVKIGAQGPAADRARAWLADLTE